MLSEELSKDMEATKGVIPYRNANLAELVFLLVDLFSILYKIIGGFCAFRHNSTLR